jgi:hypothetical protein
VIAVDLLMEEKNVTRAAQRMASRNRLCAPHKASCARRCDELLVSHRRRMIPTPHAMAPAAQVTEAAAAPLIVGSDPQL